MTEDKGCSGGDPDDCFYYAEGDKMVTEKQYPYSGIKDTCFITYDGKVGVKTYDHVKLESAPDLKAAIAKQPVAVCIEAD